jgi:16S rRNA (uracil1498-N3)-methyltransferase
VTTRILLPGPFEAGQRRLLEGEQAHYLLHVLRLADGADVHCFDGAGALWAGRVVRAPRPQARAGRDGRALQIELMHSLAAEPLPEHRLHLVQALLKGAAMDTVLQKSTELGATDIWLIAAERSNVSLSGEQRDRKHAHWQRVIESAAAQCQQLHLPLLHGPLTLAAVLAELQGVALLMLAPGAPALPAVPPSGALAVLVGPEGGFTTQEQTLAERHGAALHGLGPLILRAETAPLAVLAALRHARGWT